MLSPIGNVVSIYNIRDPYNIICISDSFNSQYFGVPIGTQFVSRNGFVDIISSNYYNYSLNCLLDACRHNGGLNCLFIDGSVRFVNKQSIEYSIVYWDIGK
jgi:prepilin-type processing-associated H-X9-DG protein